MPRAGVNPWDWTSGEEKLIRSVGLEWRRSMSPRGPYRRHSMQFKLQLCQDIRNGVIGRRDAQRTYSVSANLIQLWLSQFDRGELNQEEAEASVVAEYEGRIAALERKVGQLTMELDMAKKTPRPSPGPVNENSSIVTGPRIAP